MRLRLRKRLRSVAADDRDGAHAVHAAEHARLAIQLLRSCMACREHKHPTNHPKAPLEAPATKGCISMSFSQPAGLEVG